MELVGTLGYDSTTTDPLDDDSDDDGLLDGSEDADVDGLVDDDETDPNAHDSDGDGLIWKMGLPRGGAVRGCGGRAGRGAQITARGVGEGAS